MFFGIKILPCISALVDYIRLLTIRTEQSFKVAFYQKRPFKNLMSMEVDEDIYGFKNKHFLTYFSFFNIRKSFFSIYKCNLKTC